MTSYWIGVEAANHVVAGVGGGPGRLAPADAVAGRRARGHLSVARKFSFVTNRQHWGMYFLKSLFKIGE